MSIFNTLRFLFAAAVLATSPVHALQKKIQIRTSATASVRATTSFNTNEFYDNTKVTLGSGSMTQGRGISNANTSASADTYVQVMSSYTSTNARIETAAYLKNDLSSLQQKATSNGLIESLAIDRITFTNLAPGPDRRLNFSDLIFYRRPASFSTTGQAPSILTNNYFSYSTEIMVFDNLVDSQTLFYPKYSSTFTRCNNVFICGQSNLISPLYTNNLQSIYVDSDDVMFITNRLSIWTESTLSIAAGNLAPGSATVSSALNPRFTSRRTMAFAPGTPLVTSLFAVNGFVADSGANYLSATVPEPASWAMLIAGFGLTGAAMRQRRQGQRAVAA